MLFKLRRVPALLCVLSLAACHDSASSDPPAVPTTIARPAFFDADHHAPIVAAPQVSLPGAVTSVARNGAARFVWTHADAPAAAELAITPALRARGATTTAAVAALWHAGKNAARWQLDADALASTYVARVHDLGHGAIVVELRQRVAGVEVARTSLSVVLDRNLNLVSLSGGLHPAARPTNALLHRTPVVSASDAVAHAFSDTGVGQPVLTALPDHAGWRRLAAKGLPTPARVREVLYPFGDELVPAWQTEISARDASKKITGVRHVFAADDGRLLARTNLTQDDFAGFTYRVWADTSGDFRPLDGPQGDFTPHPTGKPDGFNPPFVPPNDVTIDGFNHAPGSGHDPWLAPAATTLTGNNVEEYADLDQIDGLSAGDVQATLTGSNAFKRTFDNTLDPQVSTAQQMAAITEQFYITNWLHDYWYDSGFTEAAGNAQTSNFGRGGVGGDVLHAEGQDSSGTDNANMTTPSDGESPTMQMFVFTAPASGGPRRDGTIDNQVIEHEWGHYLHMRLVSDCNGTQCGGMSEGWADFDSMLTGVRSGDNLNGTYGMGGYVSLEFTPDAAYFGIRRYPYSTDFTKSPLTFRFVQDGLDMPAGVDVDQGFVGDNYEVHSIGEIWCAMMWEGLTDVLKESEGANPRYTFEQARRIFSEYVVAGMMASPADPTFTEARDAVLAAIAASDQTDFVLVSKAFARRGFGAGAVSPPADSGDGQGVIEDFSTTGLISVDSATITEAQPSCDDDGFLDVGETGNVTITVRNVGAATLTGPKVTISSLTTGLRVVGSTTAQLGAIAPFSTKTAVLQVTLDESNDNPDSVSVQVSVDDASAALSHATTTITAPANIDVAPASSTFDDFTAPTLVWTVNSAWVERLAHGTTTQTVGVDVAASGDHRLQSPSLAVATGQHLVVAVTQRYQMPTASDGGVLEISTNGGTSFVDVATLSGVNPNYDTTLTGTGNVLKGRAAWTGTNISFPGFDTDTIDLGTSFGGQNVIIRFRAGGDNVADASHWDIDSVSVTGITNTPFPSLVPETGDCLPGHRPVANAGADFTIASGAASQLDGSQSSDADGDALTFSWTQVSGLAVQLSSTSAAKPTFTAPVTTVNRVLVFQLNVVDATGRQATPAQVTVHVTGTSTPVDAAVPVDAPATIDAPRAIDDTPPIDAPVVRPDAPSQADGGNGSNGNNGGGGGCAVGGDAGAGVVLLAGVALAMRRRRRRA